MYMFDGHNVFFDADATYGKSWGMNKYMNESKKQMIIVAVECNHEGNGRLEEYSPFDSETATLGLIKGRGKAYMTWLTKTLKPYIDENYRTLPDRCNTIICGSSMGGLMALYGACEYNHVFKKAACLSPSLWTDPGKLLEMIWRGEVVSEAASREMIDMMLAQQCTNKIPLLLPGEGRAAHKTGEDGGITHDDLRDSDLGRSIQSKPVVH